MIPELRPVLASSGMRRWATSLLLLLPMSCGGGDGDGERLEGAWGHGEDVRQACIVELVFEAGSFKDLTFCLLSTGQIGVEHGEGSYRESRGQITFSYLRSSCPDATRREVSFDYQINRSQLTLSTPEGAVGLSRRRKPSMIDGTSVNGCFEADNKFQPSPIRDL